jgi:hypothetical protein
MQPTDDRGPDKIRSLDFGLNVAPHASRDGQCYSGSRDEVEIINV